MLEYPDGCLTAGYPTRLGVLADAKEILACALDAPDEDPSGNHVSDADRAMFRLRLPAAASMCQSVDALSVPSVWMLGNPCFYMATNVDGLWCCEDYQHSTCPLLGSVCMLFK